ncbi:URM1 activating enzyme [Schizosaccharomyces japonicus yFS275]|uniref:Needs CLA4 to survive protein 3 n=1 Tax=Schizosaccharomyces japonicus (strain yFS275 / FY16936) TaxID=402676 RepID=B6K5C6_SCHJY|nr:URM1 activating enzyme [Schizosaccharomyces japonicus yFS275]EEB08730.1 URM1 activating enzyme [Schizosaccharomyces japonicus yFS275]
MVHECLKDSTSASSEEQFDPSFKLDEFSRYGRQMLLPEIGFSGQKAFKQTSVVVIGAGGLGCPALQYLTAAGIGHIGIVDGDVVDSSNLHRQVIHSTSRKGLPKVYSARQFCQDLNPNVKVTCFYENVSVENIFDIIRNFDVVLDCTDNQMTRYLLSDACVLSGKPLVSASAVQLEGQLLVYNFENGPCYRCMFPQPTPAASLMSCSSAGVFGPIVGVIGVMQALETLKLILRIHKAGDVEPFQPTMLLFNGFRTPQWKSVRIRGRQASCTACGPSARLSKEFMQKQANEYLSMCGDNSGATLEPIERISVHELTDILATRKDVMLLDVRPAVQYGICRLPVFRNVPIAELDTVKDVSGEICVICRTGTSSQKAVRLLKKLNPAAKIYDVIGGLSAWSKQIDPKFPTY